MPRMAANDKSADPLRETKDQGGGLDLDPDIAQTAGDFEKVFIVQMLKDAGLDKAFMGSAGAQANMFGSFLLEGIADKIVENGGFGLRALIEGSFDDA